jgi:putative endonuclease
VKRGIFFLCWFFFVDRLRTILLAVNTGAGYVEKLLCIHPYQQVTGDIHRRHIELRKRFWQHRLKRMGGFTEKYRVNRLVYFEEAGNALTAIQREKQIKGWRRSRKVALIGKMNPAWDDLSERLGLIPSKDGTAIQCKADSSLCSE